MDRQGFDDGSDPIVMRSFQKIRFHAVANSLEQIFVPPRGKSNTTNGTVGLNENGGIINIVIQTSYS